MCESKMSAEKEIAESALRENFYDYSHKKLLHMYTQKQRHDGTLSGAKGIDLCQKDDLGNRGHE